MIQSPLKRLFRWFADQIEAFTPADGPPPKRMVPFLRWSLAGSYLQIALTLGMSIAVGLSEVAAAFLVGWTIDTAQATGPGFLAEYWWALALMGLFFVLLRPVMMATNAGFNSLMLMPNIYPQVLARLNRHVIGQSLSYFDDDFAGRIAQKAQQTARALADVVSEVCNVAGFAIASVAGAFVLLAAVDARLTILLVIWTIGYVLLIRYFLPRIRLRSKDRAAARAVVTGQIVDTVTNIATVKLFSHGAFEDRATERALRDQRETSIAFGELVVMFRLTLFTLAGLLPAGLIGLTLWLWSTGAATAGDIALAGLISTRLAQMSGWVSFTALGIFSNIGEIEDGIRTLTPPHQIVDASDAVDPGRTQGGLSFEGITFGYGRPQAALDDFTLNIQPGEKVALVGQSGAGKTTVVSLLLRLYEVEGGRITLDGRDIRTLSQDALRSQIGMVRQETAMFNRSARDNIRYGTPEATQRRVEDAARRASAHTFIEDLEDLRRRKGYDAHLGERGVKLSGGQRQRIALARVILKDAPILVLDEATSALDSEVEAEIQAALEDVMRGKTVLAIAHRLSTIAQMDRIVVMEAGRIVEQGSHAQLLARNGRYAGFWARQSGGFLDVAAE
ncbi:MAG: ABC transporter ATP-binding protein [Pseudomonadota bacterium]